MEISWENVLSHPLLLLIVGAAFSSFLIPWFTNRWQDHKKSLEMKVSLIQRTTKLMSEMYTKAALAPPLRESSAEELKQVFSEWYLQGNMLRSELHAYFRDKTLRDEFDDLGNAIMAWYHVNSTFHAQDPKLKDMLKDDIETLIARLKDQKDFDTSKLSTDLNNEIWISLGDHFRTRMDKFVEKLIETDLKGF